MTRGADARRGRRARCSTGSCRSSRRRRARRATAGAALRELGPAVRDRTGHHAAPRGVPGARRPRTSPRRRPGAPDGGAVQRRLLHAGVGARRASSTRSSRGPASRPGGARERTARSGGRDGRRLLRAAARATPTAARRLLIRAGSARAYYVGAAATAGTAPAPSASCRAARRRARRSRSIARSPSRPTSRSRSRSTARTERNDRARTTSSTFTDDGRRAPARAARDRAALRQAIAPGRARRRPAGRLHRDRHARAVVRVARAPITAGAWRSTFARRKRTRSSAEASRATRATTRGRAVVDTAALEQRGAADRPAVVRRRRGDPGRRRRRSSADLEATLGFGKQAWPLGGDPAAGRRAARMSAGGARGRRHTKCAG